MKTLLWLLLYIWKTVMAFFHWSHCANIETYFRPLDYVILKSSCMSLGISPQGYHHDIGRDFWGMRCNMQAPPSKQAYSPTGAPEQSWRSPKESRLNIFCHGSLALSVIPTSQKDLSEVGLDLRSIKSLGCIEIKPCSCPQCLGP